MKKLQLAFVGVCLIVEALAQVDLQENVRYEGNTHLNVPILGLSFIVPPGWYGGVSSGSPYMVLADATNDVTIIITGDEMKESEVFGELQRQIALDENISLSPIGMVKKEGRRWWGNYTINGATQDMRCYIEVRLGDFGIGASCIVMAFPSSFEKGKKAATDLLSGMTFKTPVKPEVAAASGITQPWNEFLKGKSLKYYYTQGSFSDTDFIYLCSNGTFTRSKSTYSGGVTGTGALWGGDQGTWQASGQGDNGALTLLNRDGTKTEFRLEYRQGTKGLGLYLNGYRYYVEASGTCN